MKYLLLVSLLLVAVACGPTCAQRGGHIEYGAPSGYDLPLYDADGNLTIVWVDTTPEYCVGAKEKAKK